MKPLERVPPAVVIVVCVFAVALVFFTGCDKIKFDLTSPINTVVEKKVIKNVTDLEFNKLLSNITDNSKCSKYAWKNRGTANKSYYRGMGKTYAKAYCHPSTLVSTRRCIPESSCDRTDVLSWYNSDFHKLKLDNDVSGRYVQRHVWTLLIGLGMRESSGRYCVGRDLSMNFTTAESAEAGLFQSSWGARKRDPSMVTLFNKYQSNKTGCYYEIFKEGYKCSQADLKNWGSGDGLKFQELSKTCPAFSAEYASILVRKSGGTKGEYGPLRSKKSELNLDCDNMLQDIEKLVDDTDICTKI